MSGETGRTFNLSDGNGGTVTYETVGVPEMARQPDDPRRRTDGQELVAAVRARAVLEAAAAQAAGPAAVQSS